MNENNENMFVCEISDINSYTMTMYHTKFKKIKFINSSLIKLLYDLFDTIDNSMLYSHIIKIDYIHNNKYKLDQLTIFIDNNSTFYHNHVCLKSLTRNIIYRISELPSLFELVKYYDTQFNSGDNINNNVNYMILLSIHDMIKNHYEYMDNYNNQFIQPINPTQPIRPDSSVQPNQSNKANIKLKNKSKNKSNNVSIDELDNLTNKLSQITNSINNLNTKPLIQVDEPKTLNITDTDLFLHQKKDYQEYINNNATGNMFISDTNKDDEGVDTTDLEEFKNYIDSLEKMNNEIDSKCEELKGDINKEKDDLALYTSETYLKEYELRKQKEKEEQERDIFISNKTTTYPRIFEHFFHENIIKSWDDIPLLFRSKFPVFLYLDGRDLEGRQSHKRYLDTDDEFRLFNILHEAYTNEDDFDLELISIEDEKILSDFLNNNLPPYKDDVITEQDVYDALKKTIDPKVLEIFENEETGRENNDDDDNDDDNDENITNKPKYHHKPRDECELNTYTKPLE